MYVGYRGLTSTREFSTHKKSLVSVFLLKSGKKKTEENRICAGAGVLYNNRVLLSSFDPENKTRVHPSILKWCSFYKHGWRRKGGER